MQLIPFRTTTERYNIFVILEDANLERMKGHDPAQFMLRKLPPEWAELKLETVIIGYANPADLERVRRLIAHGNAATALEYLSRGFAFKPGEGDHDKPYKRGP